MVKITINGKKLEREFQNMAQALAFAYQNGECYGAEKIEIVNAAPKAKEPEPQPEPQPEQAPVGTPVPDGGGDNTAEAVPTEPTEAAPQDEGTAVEGEAGAQGSAAQGGGGDNTAEVF